MERTLWYRCSGVYGKLALLCQMNRHSKIFVSDSNEWSKAAGMVPVAHKSGGPLMDIVTEYNNQPTGKIQRPHIWMFEYVNAQVLTPPFANPRFPRWQCGWICSSHEDSYWFVSRRICSYCLQCSGVCMWQILRTRLRRRHPSIFATKLNVNWTHLYRVTYVLSIEK